MIQVVGCDALQFEQILADIQKFSLLQRNAANNMLSIHRLVQDDIRVDLTPRQQKEYALRTVRLLAAVFPSGDFDIDDWSQCERLLASSLKISESIFTEHKDFQNYIQNIVSNVLIIS